MRGIAWKAILSEAVVTGGEALGMSVLKSCLKGSTSYQNKHIARYSLPGSCPHALNPGTLSWVTTASLSTALQAGRYLHANLIQKFLFRLKSNTSLSVTCCQQTSGRYFYDNTDNRDNKPTATEKLSLLSSQKILCAENHNRGNLSCICCMSLRDILCCAHSSCCFCCPCCRKTPKD